MIEISVKADVDAAIRRLNAIQRQQVPFAASVAINNTANDAKLAMRAEIASALDRPKPYTLGGLFVARSNKRNLVATVGLIDKPKAGNTPPGKYLGPQIAGGTRSLKKFEALLRRSGALPTGYQIAPGGAAKLDAYGNIARSQLNELIGVVKSSIKNLRVFAGKGKRAHARGYFIARPGERKTQHLQPGVYQRIERGAESVPRPILAFINTARYQKRLDVVGPARRIVARNFPGHFEQAMAKALATAT